MTEWRLFEEGTIPEWTTPEFFQAHPRIAPEHQLGHAERTTMVADLIRSFVPRHQVNSLVDLGCGDGSLLDLIRDLPIPMWGYDAGAENVKHARENDLDVRIADLLTSTLEFADLIVATEVVEHLVDPHGFIRSLPGTKLILSSPSAEDDEWHYEHHSWAWDITGYRDLVTGCGWRVVDHWECDAPDNFHGDVRRPQRFQTIAAIK